MLEFHMPLVALFLTSCTFLPTIHAIPHPVAEPSFFDDIVGVVTGYKDPSTILGDLQDITDEIKGVAEAAWNSEVDGCLAVQCAAGLNPAVLTCVASLIKENPLSCFVELIATVKDITEQDKCDGCAEAVESFIESAGS